VNLEGLISNTFGFRLKPDLPGIDKLKAVKNTEVPKTVKEVRQFIYISTNMHRTESKSSYGFI
jgi:hypothetical protein